MVHAIHLCHSVISSPCHPVTLSSIHPAINSHLTCCPFSMSSSQDHGPCHPFTMSSIHRLSQSPCHSGPISSYHPQVTRPEEFNQKEFLVLLETTLARGASTLGKILLSLFCLCYLPLLLALSAHNIFPTAGAAKTYLYCRPLNYFNLGYNHGRHYSSLCSCCVWFYSNIDLVMPKIISISVLCSLLLISQILCKFQSIV